MFWKLAVALSGAITAIATLACVARVAWHEDRELYASARATIEELSREESATAESVRLARAHLTRDQEVTFEICADDPMEPSRWAGAMAIAVWRPRARELMTRSALDARTLALVRRSETRGCLLIGRGTIGEDDEYAVEAFWDAHPDRVASIPITTTILARRPIEALDRWLVIAAWLGALAFALSLALRRPRSDDREDATAIAARAAGDLARDHAIAATAPTTDRDGAQAIASRTDRDDAQAIAPPASTDLDDAIARRSSAPALDEWEAAQMAAAPKIPNAVRVVIGLALVIASFLASALLPPGAAMALAVSVVLALFEAGVGVALAPGPGLARRFALLALHRPSRWWLHFPIALAAGAVLWIVANLSTLLVPSTGESAIQTFVSWPSGLLSFASLAVLAPLAEEIFFRGFVYGALEKQSRAAAFLCAWLLFVLAHAPQTWGQWGALVALTFTGLALTTLRATSKSTLVPAVAHLVYNGLLATSALGVWSG